VVQAGLAHHRDDRVAGQPVDDGHKVGVVLFFNGDLQLAGDVLEHDEGHGLAAAQVFDKALHFYGLAGVAAHVGNIGSLHTKSSRPWRGAMECVYFFNMSWVYYTLFQNKIKGPAGALPAGPLLPGVYLSFSSAASSK